jgi:hypothetical protein
VMLCPSTTATSMFFGRSILRMLLTGSGHMQIPGKTVSLLMAVAFFSISCTFGWRRFWQELSFQKYPGNPCFSQHRYL